ncbi:hypothetical protein MMC14_009271 [Varicellaria rhodocarpa]|nr:hypothetical protein [Varicellaria rhodocarpa]
MAAKASPPPISARALVQVDPLYKELSLTSLRVPRVRPNSDEHLIRVHTVAICNGELLWMKNFPPADLTSKDLVPTFDVAGTVVEAPASSTFCPGDEVYARTSPGRTGCARDYAIALTEELAHRSQRLTWAESAALPLSAQTAWQALFIHAGLDSIGANHASGKRVLVTAAAGGVGAWVMQLSNLAGAEVIGTCGPQNAKLVQSLGAREVIDYHTADIREWGQSPQNQVGIVIDCVGGKALEDVWWTVRDGGILISVVQPPEIVRPADCTAKDTRASGPAGIPKSD